MKKIYTLALFAAVALAASAQVKQSELAGKYHLQAKYDLWEGTSANDVYAHDEFTFTLEEQTDGTFRLYSFFYNGMDESWNRLGYGATAQYSPSEQLLYVYQTPWLWDEYMGKFMESYGYGQGDGPMMYFLVQKDPKSGTIRLASTENSLGFYMHSYYQGQSTFVYAVDYPGVVSATKLDTRPLPATDELVGDWTLAYNDENGRAKTSEFTIEKKGKDLVMKGLFGMKKEQPMYVESDGCGLYIPLDRVENNGYYVSYFGTNVGDCRVSFHCNAEGQLVSDNYFSYSPDFRNWTDAFDAVATKQGGADGVATLAAQPAASSSLTYSLSGCRTQSAAPGRIVIKGGRKQILK